MKVITITIIANPYRNIYSTLHVAINTPKDHTNYLVVTPRIMIPITEVGDS